MKVAFVDQAAKESGGAQESLALLLQNLPNDVDPEVVLFGEGEYASRLRGMGLTVHALSSSTGIADATRDRISAASLLAARSTGLELRRTLHKIQPAVVHTNTIKAHLLGGIAARALRRPSVAHLRDVLEGGARQLVRSVTNFASNERIAISSLVDKNFALTHTTVLENPLELGIYDGLPERHAARTQLKLPQEAVIFSLVGRINRWKGHDRFLRCAIQLAPRYPAHFVIAGAPRFRDADFLPELKEMVRANALESRVTFLDWLDDPLLLYAATDVNVNCSDKEPFGRTIIEAAACGVPSIVYDDAGVAEFMDSSSGGTVVSAGDQQGLCQAMRAFIESTPAQQNLRSAEARAWSKRFDAKVHATRVVDILVRATSR